MLKFLKRHPKKLISMAAVLLLLGYCQTRERRFLERFVFEYAALNHIRDEKTGKIIELGVLSNFSSTAYEVGVFDGVNPRRHTANLHTPVIVLIGGMDPDPRLEYDGECYFVRGESALGDLDKVVPTWTDPTSGNQLCFYVLTSYGKKITSFH